MLLGDTDVEEAVGEAFAEGGQTGRTRHRGGDGDNIAPLAGVGDERVGEHRRPSWCRRLGGQAGLRVDHPAGVHLFGFVVLGRRIPVALAGHRVHDHRRAEAAGESQRVLQGVLVVAVDGADVLQAEVGEHGLRGQRVLDARLDAVHRLVADLADDRHAAHRRPGPLQQSLVDRLQPQPGEVVGQAADGRRIAATVVVDHDDHRPPGRGDIVQRLPAHAAGERSVPDDGDHVPVALPGQLEGLGQAVGVGERG